MSSDLRYMLASAVTVRRAERRHACRSAEAKQAWQEGIAAVQADYGGRLLTQMKQDLGARAPGRAVLSVWYVMRYYRRTHPARTRRSQAGGAAPALRPVVSPSS